MGMKRNASYHNPLEDVNDPDLCLINTIWDLKTEKPFELRPSNRHVFRQGCLALDRLGQRLTSFLSHKGVVGYTPFPTVTPRTRFRRVPKKLLLEFVLQNRSEFSTKTQSLFVEFTTSNWSLGLSVGNLASEQENKDFWKNLRDRAPVVFKELQDNLLEEASLASHSSKHSSGWHVSPYRTPLPYGVCSADLKNIINKQQEGRKKLARSFTIKKTFDTRCISFSSLSADLISTVNFLNLTLSSKSKLNSEELIFRTKRRNYFAELN